MGVFPVDWLVVDRSSTMVTVSLLRCTKAPKRVLFTGEMAYNSICPTVLVRLAIKNEKRLSSPSCQSRDVLRRHLNGGLVGSRIRQAHCRYSFRRGRGLLPGLAVSRRFLPVPVARRSPFLVVAPRSPSLAGPRCSKGQYCKEGIGTWQEKVYTAFEQTANLSPGTGGDRDDRERHVCKLHSYGPLLAPASPS